MLSRATSGAGGRFNWKSVATVVGVAGLMPLLVAACGASRSRERQPDGAPPSLDRPSALATAAAVPAEPSPPKQPARTQRWVNPNAGVCMKSPDAAFPPAGGTGGGRQGAGTTGDAGATRAATRKHRQRCSCRRWDASSNSVPVTKRFSIGGIHARPVKFAWRFAWIAKGKSLQSQRKHRESIERRSSACSQPSATIALIRP